MRRKRGVAVQAGGVALLGLTVLAYLLTSSVTGGLVLGVLSSAACAIGGIAVFARGTLMVGQSTRRLLALREMRKLPVARVRQLPSG